MDFSNTYFDKHHIWHPFSATRSENINVVKAKDCTLFLEDGREILDVISSWWTNLHGHSHPKLAEALYQQAQTMEHVIFANFTHNPAIQLGRNLLSILPQNQHKVFFSDNGSTAVEVGLKLAIQYWYNLGKPKKRIVSIEGAYHGDTFGSMSIAGKSSFFLPFEPFLFDVEQIPFPDENNFDHCINQFEKILQKGDIAAFIYEPLVQGSAGMRIYSPSQLEQLLFLAKKYEVICIADEVMTGFGRTGTYFASLQTPINPDIVCVSKGITGGCMPLGVTTCSDEIEKSFLTDDVSKWFYHGHSYTGNPLSCAVANASFEILTSSETQENIKTITESHKKFINFIKEEEGIKNIEQCGTILSLTFETKEKTSYFNSLKKVIFDFGLENGILLRPLGNTVYLIPPYCITKTELGKTYAIIEKLIKHVQKL